jgi:hydroxyquinol 1,2-dioxygenase
MDFWQTDGEKGARPTAASPLCNARWHPTLIEFHVAGVYDVQLDGEYKMFGRGHFRTNQDGSYAFRHVKPIPYPIPTDGTFLCLLRSLRQAACDVPLAGPVGDMLSKMGRHPMRPAHIHAILLCDGYKPLTTHLFLKGDPCVARVFPHIIEKMSRLDRYNESDTVFGVKESLIVEFVEHSAGATPDGGVSLTPFYTAEFNFVLARK